MHVIVVKTSIAIILVDHQYVDVKLEIEVVLHVDVVHGILGQLGEQLNTHAIIVVVNQNLEQYINKKGVLI